MQKRTQLKKNSIRADMRRDRSGIILTDKTIIAKSSSVIAIFLLVFSCSSSSQVMNSGVVIHKTFFYNKEGDTTFSHYMKIWYKDSLFIEEIRGVNTVTDASGKTTVTYPLLFCRFIDTRNKVLYDYKTFSDTARVFHKAALPDSLMLDAGWSFYSAKYPVISGSPESLSDTTIDNVTYKRKKFNFDSDNAAERFIIGFFRCDRESIFSIEKKYSNSINCLLVKMFDYKTDAPAPFASKEIEFASETLTEAELMVFDAWEKNVKQNPVLAK